MTLGSLREVQRPIRQSSATTALNAAVRLWFFVAVVGQTLLAAYVVAFYGRAALDNDLARWNKVLSGGYIPGDGLGNVILAVHLVLAVIITLGGPLQLIPQIRSRFPAFHRWTGRVYLATALLISPAGLYLIWIRGGVVGGLVQHLGTSLNAVLILLFAALALRTAMARQFSAHRRWALRLYLAVSGVWFFRVGLMFWLIVNQGPAGFDPKTFLGPFLDFLAFAQYLVPLGVLQLYFYTQDRAGSRGKFAMAAGLIVLTIAMGIGIFGAAMGMWLPRI